MLPSRQPTMSDPALRGHTLGSIPDIYVAGGRQTPSTGTPTQPPPTPVPWPRGRRPTRPRRPTSFCTRERCGGCGTANNNTTKFSLPASSPPRARTRVWSSSQYPPPQRRSHQTTGSARSDDCASEYPASCHWRSGNATAPATGGQFVVRTLAPNTPNHVERMSRWNPCTGCTAGGDASG